MQAAVSNDLTFTERHDTRLRGFVGGISSGDFVDEDDDDHDREYQDMKQSQADYLLGPSPELSRSVSEDRYSKRQHRWTPPRRDLSPGDESDQRSSEAMCTIKNPDKDESTMTGWGFAAGLQKVQQTTKGAIKGMRR